MTVARSRPAVLRVAYLALAFHFSFAAVASAQEVMMVGPTCEFTQIQDAVDHVRGEIHVMTGTYRSFQVTGKVVFVGGGYPDCNPSSLPIPGAKSTISGGGVASAIKVRSGSDNNTILNLHDLEVVGGNPANASNSGNGGGISFNGHGELDLTRVNVFGNYADNGGGIDVKPDGPATGQFYPDGKTIVSLSGSIVSNNSSEFDGAGIRIRGTTHLLILKDALSDLMSISSNSAGVDATGNVLNNTAIGGGLLADSEAHADISSTSTANFNGLFHHNLAGYGGGIGVTNNGSVRIFTTSPSEMVRIGSNVALRAGGGIFMGDSGSRVCAFGYDISLNGALNGAAIYADTETFGANLKFGDLGAYNFTPHRCSPESAFSPPYNAVYPSISNQISANKASQNDGAIVLIQDGEDNSFRAEHIRLQYNVGGSALRIFPSDIDSQLSTCLLTDNLSRQELVRSQSTLRIDGCTLANNEIGAGNVLATSTPSILSHSIFWQPGKATINRNILQFIAESILNDAGSYGGGTHLSSADPSFISIDPFLENYHLSLNSPAVDYTPISAGVNTDLDVHGRGIVIRDEAARFDIGAYERQTGSAPVTFPPDENFDELYGLEQVRGVLPVNWETAGIGSGRGWTTVGAGSDQLLAFAGNPETVGESRLDTPQLNVLSGARLSFDQLVSLEANFDGAVLEIAIDGAAFADVAAAGGQFIEGGYNATLSGLFGNPLGGRQAWSGDSGGYVHVVVDLPEAADGGRIQLRWRLGTDSSNAGEPMYGYWIDNIHVDLGESSSDTIFSNGFE